MNENGKISVNTDDIFPIIKKWLYSDKDIFIREMVSNACDSINKLKRLVAMGEAEINDDKKYLVRVVFNKKNKTIKFIDNGIGMTAEEVKKYINQVAFSGAKDFVEKYKDKIGEENQIIGHFGLGFYSAFMVSEKVQIDTLSYQEGAQPVKWVSEGGTEYTLADSDKKDVGTTVTLYIDSGNTEFLNEFQLRQTLDKYCSFLPIEIYLENEEEKGKKTDEKDKKEEPKPINDTNPLWVKKPSECTDEEYKDFYKKVFADFNDPLFWIHLNVDHPFNLKGILYFPKLKHEFEGNEGRVKLYNNQVFVADNIKEVIPEFLLLLKGVIDCPDLPLNVSRSFLQNDGYVRKVSSHITKKVSDKLIGLFKNKREDFNTYWEDINPFVKYGCMRDEKFYERVKEAIIFKTIYGEYVTLEEHLNKNKGEHKDKVFYVTDENQQAQYVNLFKEQNLDAVILTSTIDSHFIQFLEMKEDKVKFSRIDSDLSDSLKDKDGSENEDNDKDLESIFKEALNNQDIKIEIENLKTENVPAVILLAEEPRRMQEMTRMFGVMGLNQQFPQEHTLVINRNNLLIKSLVSMKDKEDKKEDINLMCEHIYDLAMMGHRQLETAAMTKFIARSNNILSRLAKVENQ
jgi:molecular chaperone HtpG